MRQWPTLWNCGRGVGRGSQRGISLLEWSCNNRETTQTAQSEERERDRERRKQWEKRQFTVAMTEIEIEWAIEWVIDRDTDRDRVIDRVDCDKNKQSCGHVCFLLSPLGSSILSFVFLIDAVCVESSLCLPSLNIYIYIYLNMFSNASLLYTAY